ncbi:villin-2-like [Phalaenopsis equestris]|uniref:villin-2-like n=1 Tax=Phalaenopsis equestris TaxID=78828 RepID=UPI0009E3A618|nr:villin-2-like [Phalaenopsis equestris]XP_020585777.1 villin-2-like [Phalaenopsis equestris]XP_020585778.1 villin-2-like [Phalaenopsis equestris]XP_020585780.1 villin-2-like [Phalaenopsis equestris]
MSTSTKILDPAFQGAGQRVGTEIWRIENFEPVPLPKTDHGKFYSGDSYIILQTTSGKGGSYVYDIHYWIGKDTSQDEAGTAAIKTIELDASLGGRAVQHRELQGHESDKFLSYFKPCIIPLEGGVASGFKKPEEEKFESRLFVCRGKRVVRMKQVLFARSSLNHDDVFILDTENKIYQFNGANSNIQERAKSLEVIQYLKDKYHEGKCDVAIIDDGKLVAESDSGEFWVLFGGFAPIGKKPTGEDDVFMEKSPAKLYSINDGQLKLEEGSLSKAMLENNKCYLLDCGAEIHVWVGRVTQLEERKAACKAAEELINNESRPKATKISQIIQGYETHSFKSNFESWPLVTGTGSAAGEEGRGKVAALLKQQGIDVKGSTKTSPVNEDVPPLFDGGGKVEVWRINGSAKTSIPQEDVGKFFSGDCYIILYTYHSGEKKEDYFLACWIGNESIQDDHMTASRLANTMWTYMKGRPVQGRIFQGKEPPQFIALFQPMVVLKGGLSTGYKKSVEENNIRDETYASDSIALIRVSGTSAHNNAAVQVDAVATSLNSYDCFLLQSGNTLFIWQGSSSSFEQQQLATNIAEFLKPGAAFKHAKEGTESSAFWFALGGKQSFSSSKVTTDIFRDPHLYTFSFNKEKLEVTEVFNFVQDDLLSEDMLILDTHSEVFIWIGQCVETKEKQRAFDMGEKYIELAGCLEGLASDVPLYRVTEGNEPCFFTAYFTWDGAKAAAHGNSFEKKLAILFGTVFHTSESKDKSNNANQSGPTQRASALAALSSAFNPHSKAKPANPIPVRSTKGGSQRAAAVAALSSVLTAEQKKAQAEGSTRRFGRNSPPDSNTIESLKGETASSVTWDPAEDSTEKEVIEGEGSVSESSDASLEASGDTSVEDNADENTYSYERLKAKSRKPITGIDYKRREAYLSDEEFQTVFGMTKEAFYQQPKWKQDMQKRKFDLF